MRLAAPFHDHAVLQRDVPIPVWGEAAPGERIAVRLAGRTAHVRCGGDGRWLVRLPALPAGGPHELVVEGAAAAIRVADVLVGEVWLCSGQSNMEWTVEKLGASQIPDPAERPRLRLLTVGTPADLGQPGDLGGGRWSPCTAASLRGFSGCALHFGLRLEEELGVPVGLICNAWGGTRIQAWMSRSALVEDPSGAEEVAAYEARLWSGEVDDDATGSLHERERRHAPPHLPDRGLERGWAGAGFDDGAWAAMELPGSWQSAGLLHSGILWFRRTVTVPAAWAGRDLVLHLGSIDKHDDTWVNGERVGGLDWADGPDSWSIRRAYPVPARLVGADRRLAIAVRARSHIYDGGLRGPPEAMHLAPAGGGGALPLAGTWRYAVEADWGSTTRLVLPWGPGNPNSPGILFGSRLAPLIPYGLRGVIWYQGESNAGEAARYRRLLPALIRDWRRAWGQGPFPFIQVQLAGYRQPAPQPGRSEWAELREAQAAALAEAEVGMAVAIDVGEAENIHPQDKRTVGRRLAQWALSAVHGRPLPPSGPLFAGASIAADGRVRCRFRHGEGLATRDGGAVRQVAIAGSDRRFRWAETAIADGVLEAWHAGIPHPAAVRYAWADNPAGCNLVNAAGLPAAPFRSDDWPA